MLQDELFATDIEINWLKIATAIEFYKLLGYKYVEVPWKIPLNVQRITFPPLSDTSASRIVGSAEQSFLYQELHGKQAKGKFVTCTPCVRKEKEYDRLRQHWFMKVELYQNVKVDDANLNLLISDCFKVFSHLVTMSDVLKTVKTDEGYDINLNGIEVGSYGIRHHEKFDWIYGTGIAEPRFSTALKIGKETDYKDNINDGKSFFT